jgi:5-formyltetrahydrofolate cyclo-ligase
VPKRKVRAAMLAQRRSFSADELQSLSQGIQSAFLESLEYARAKVIVAYSPIQNEVGTELIVTAALASGKRVAFPVVMGHRLIFREINDLVSFREGAYGIAEPCPTCVDFSPDDADLFIVPGIAFDLRGHRVGYGKGYYDKTLHRLEGQGKLVGLCYDFQLVEEISGEPHDVKMDLILTETREIRPAGD